MKKLAMVGLVLVLAGGLMTPALAKSKGNNGGSGDYSTTTLSSAETDALRFLREEEKLARDVYLTLHNQWELDIFANIADSEQRHMDVIGNLLDQYRIPDPAVRQIGVFTNPALQSAYDLLVANGSESLIEALRAGGYIEELDIGDLDDAMAATTHDDLLQAFESLQCASRNHLRAFARALENRGVTYEAQVLTQEEVDAVIDSPMERGCGN